MVHHHFHIFNGTISCKLGNICTAWHFWHIFFPFDKLSHKVNTYGETVLVIKILFHFSPQFLFETLHCDKYLSIYITHEETSIHYRWQIFTKTGMYQNCLVKMPYMKQRNLIYRFSSCCMRADRHSEAEKCIFATSHCECTKENKYAIYIIRR
jgi:hypothetical protein